MSQAEPTSPFPKTPNGKKPTILPWVVAGVLGVACIALAILLVIQTLNGQQNSATPTPQNSATPTPQNSATPAPRDTSSPTGAEQQIPQPVTDPDAIKVLDALPSRDPADRLAMGSADAPAVLIVWSDFRCPFCSVWERETLPKLKPYVDSGSLRVEHRDLVLFGEDSERSAIAARAAGEQGKFWEFSAAIAAKAPRSGHPVIDDAAITEFAKEAGVPDLAKFEAARKDPAHRTAFTNDTNFAQKLGIQGTPFFIVNRTPIQGAMPLEVFESVIKANGGKK